ncbi:MAG: ABC transporter ATP-binding protein [Clostridium sp.]
MDTILEVKHLTISFIQYAQGLKQRELHPVRDLSLSVHAGEMTALVGASGSGKSLLAHAVMGLMPYNCLISGEIYFAGTRLTEKRLKKIRGNDIALVPQGVSYLDPLMRVGEQIKQGKKDAKTAARCSELLNRYGLSKETESLYPFELSGGMARRVLIAAALMENPKLVIADEPTPGLDLHTARRVMGHFKEMTETGAGVLLITHDLELALETADRLLVFYEGEAVEEIRAEDFKKGEKLKHPYTKALFRALSQPELIVGGSI